MPLNWAAFAFGEFFKKFGWTALGGALVTIALVAYTGLFQAAGMAGAARGALDEIKTGIAAPNEFVLFVVLLLFFAYLLLSGAWLPNLLAKAALRPVIDFCIDAACLGTGVVVVLAVVSKDAGVGLQALWLVATAIILHGANTIVDGFASAGGPPGLVQKVAAVLSAVVLIALFIVANAK